jgi:drug/metabolite transporter (DMT)-like permease
MLLLTLRGTPTSTTAMSWAWRTAIPPDKIQDPQGMNLGAHRTRDVCRTPMQWSDAPQAGLHHRRALAAVTVIGSLNPILLFLGLQFTLASVSPLIYAAVPLMTALYLYKVKHQPIASGKILGIVVGFLGVAIIILLPFFQNGKFDISSVWGNILILGAAVAFMFYGIVSKDQQQQNNTSALALTFYLSIVTVAVAIPFSIYELIQQPVVLSSVQPKHILAGLETGMVGTSLFYISYQKALKLGNELTASLFTYLQPISVILFAMLLLGEKITPPFLVGGALAVIGAGMASKASGKRTPLAGSAL